MVLRTAVITFRGEPSGVLAETPDGGSRFTYRDGWTVPIGCALAASEREHLWSWGLHPFFEHMGPEGWIREKQARIGRVDGDDDLGLLLRYGEDCIGAVGVVAPGSRSADFAPSQDIETEAATGVRRTLSGVQRKLLAYWSEGRFHPATAGTPATHIAKFNGPNDDALVRNEALTLTLAGELLGAGEVTRFATAVVAELDERALVVERFDREADGRKLRMEDFAQILLKPRGRDVRGKYEASYEQAADAIRRHSARPVIDVGRFFRRLLVNVLLGNADAHLKNFSLLETSAGMRLSPAYDVVNTLVCGARYDGRTALALLDDQPQLDAVTQEDMIAFGLRIGLGPRAIRNALADLKARARRSRLLTAGPQPPDEFLDSYIAIVRAQAGRLLEP